MLNDTSTKFSVISQKRVYYGDVYVYSNNSFIEAYAIFYVNSELRFQPMLRNEKEKYEN